MAPDRPAGQTDVGMAEVMQFAAGRNAGWAIFIRKRPMFGNAAVLATAWSMCTIPHRPTRSRPQSCSIPIRYFAPVLPGAAIF
jgi:hypothetical protein